MGGESIAAFKSSLGTLDLRWLISVRVLLAALVCVGILLACSCFFLAVQRKHHTSVFHRNGNVAKTFAKVDLLSLAKCFASA